MNNFERIYKNLTLNAYWENKAAKSINRKYYKNKARYVLESLRTIKDNKMSNISYHIKKEENSYSIIFTFHKKDVYYKTASFHLPLIYEDKLKRYMNGN